MFLGLYVETYGIIFSFLSGTVFLNVSLSTSRALFIPWSMFWIFLFQKKFFNSLNYYINFTSSDTMTLNLRDKENGTFTFV